jgi:NAD-dependent deacetylase
VEHRTPFASRIPEMIRAQRRTVVLTGAGVSAESGVPTFRGPEGLWLGRRPEELATPAAFARDPVGVWAWYRWRRQRVADCAPNAAHHACAWLDQRLPELQLITQNVDGLHRAAGSRRVLELHGCIWEARCTREGTIREDRAPEITEAVPRCACGAELRPHVVWFGEALDPGILADATAAARAAELMLVVGTSAVVEPAASLPRLARRAGAYVVEVNPEETPLSAICHEVHRGPAAELLPALVGYEATT